MSGRSTGFNIRRFILQRRPQNGGEAGDLDNDGGFHPRQASTKRDSWFTSRRPNSRKRPPTPIIISRPQHVRNTLSPLPSMLYETPRSSASSLCSCGETFAAVKPSPLCSISSTDDRSESSLPLSSATTTSYEPDDLSPQFSIKDQQLCTMFVRNKAERSSSKLDLVEALSLEPEDKGNPTDKRDSDKDSAVELSESIQRLIEEADEAFKAMAALGEPQLTRRSFNETPKLPPLDTQQQQQQQQTLPTVRISSLKTPPRLITPPIFPKRNVSLNRDKSKGSKKMKPPRKPAVMKPLPKRNSRWAIGENVSEMLSGMLFHRIEVDEMLTPTQLEAYKLKRMSKLQVQLQAGMKNSAESLGTFDTESTDTPIEPFHMDDLPLRIGSSGVKLTAATPVDDDKNEVPPVFEDSVARDFSYQHKDDELFLSTGLDRPLSSIQEDPMEYKNLTFPTPPAKRLVSRKHLPPLPSIPEATATTATTATTDTTVASTGTSTNNTRDDELFLILNNTPLVSHDFVADNKYLYLRATPCTLTVPVFRHGPIRLAKSDLAPDPKLGADDILDWTAFQMAILGGAGDWFSESQDALSREEEAEDLEDLLDWWDNWHFQSAGGLITREVGHADAHDKQQKQHQRHPQPPSPTSTISVADHGDLSSSAVPFAEFGQHDDGNPHSASNKWQRLKQQVAAEGRSLDLNLDQATPAAAVTATTTAAAAAAAAASTTAGSNGQQVPMSAVAAGGLLAVQRDSLASLPQSPMFDLQMVKSDNGDVDYVPMGYNLGHDLGDFLRWEAEHVYSDASMYDGGII